MNWRNNPRKKRNKIWLVSKEDLEKITINSSSLSDILKYYGLATSSGNYTALKSRLHQENISIEHISLGLSSNKNRDMYWLKAREIPLNEILIEHSSFSRKRLKFRLLNDGLLKNICYKCGIGPSWNEQKLSLQLDHINGISDDNRLENLRILCPNCHSQTETFGYKRGKKLLG